MSRDVYSDAYQAALYAWKSNGGPRPHLRPDGIPTRVDVNWRTDAEKAISAAMAAVEMAGSSPALTDAVTLLSKARDRVADHVEEYEIDNPLTDAERDEALATGHADLLIDVGPCGMAYRELVARAKQAEEAFLEYGRHSGGCNAPFGRAYPCKCGFDDACATIRAKGDK